MPKTHKECVPEAPIATHTQFWLKANKFRKSNPDGWIFNLKLLVKFFEFFEMTQKKALLLIDIKLNIS